MKSYYLIHTHLARRSKIYTAWHETKYHQPVHWLTFSLVVAAVFIIFVWQINFNLQPLGLKTDIPLAKAQTVSLTVDASKSLENFEHFWGGFGYDPLKSSTISTPNRKIYEAIGEVNRRQSNTFNFQRAHNIFTTNGNVGWADTGCDVYSENGQGQPQYDWTCVDQVYDVIIGPSNARTGVKPIVEFSFMPEDLAVDTSHVNWGGGIISIPKDWNKWRNLVYETVKHLQSRYGASEIETWRFEVWNEPDLFGSAGSSWYFWNGDPNNSSSCVKHTTSCLPDHDNLNKLYDYAVAGALAANPRIKVGGPAVAGWDDTFKAFLDHVDHGTNYVTGGIGTQIDFISFHKYGSIDGYIINNLESLMDVAFSVNNNKFSNIEFLLDEYGPTTGCDGTWCASRYVAPWLTKAIDGMFDLVDRKGLKYRPDGMVWWGTEVEDPGSFGVPLSGGFGVFFSNAPERIIKLPLFNIHEALGKLGNQRISLTGTDYGDPIHGVATRHGNSSIEIVIYHIDEDDRDNTDNNLHNLNLTINNLPFNNFSLYQYTIDRDHGNILDTWENMGSPNTPSSAQLQQLENIDDLSLAAPVASQTAVNGSFNKSVQLMSNSMTLLVLTNTTSVGVSPGQCSDNTSYNHCSSSQPKYCNSSGQLNDNCGQCGCPTGQQCQTNGTCQNASSNTATGGNNNTILSCWDAVKGPCFPRTSLFNWGGSTPYWYAKFSVITSRSTNGNDAQAIKAINPATQVISMPGDWNCGDPRERTPDGWLLHTSGGQIIEDYCSPGTGNLSDICPLDGGQRLNDISYAP